MCDGLRFVRMISVDLQTMWANCNSTNGFGLLISHWKRVRKRTTRISITRSTMLHPAVPVRIGSTQMRSFFRYLLISALSFALACSEAPEQDNGPALRSVSSQALVVGQTLDFYFSGVQFDKNRDYRVFFDGVFQSDNGSTETVLASQKVIEDGYLVNGSDTFSALRLSRFGPFKNPLSDSRRPGRFDGTVSVFEIDSTGEPQSLKPNAFAICRAFNCH